MKPNKYGNKKLTNADGTFDSKGEWLRWCFLKDQQANGVIRDLRRQVTYVLVPPVHYAKTLHLKTKDKTVERVWTREVTYTADFVYQALRITDERPLLTVGYWETVVEDFKGMPNDRWPIKKALMAFVHGIYVREVKRPAEPINIDEK
jgi:hypothetical protein